MSQRYTRKDAEGAFHRLREAVGRRDAFNLRIDDPRREGAWQLASGYGGYRVEQIVASSPPRPHEDRPQNYSAINCPLDHGYQSAREFCEAVAFTLNALRYRPNLDAATLREAAEIVDINRPITGAACAEKLTRAAERLERN